MEHIMDRIKRKFLANRGKSQEEIEVIMKQNIGVCPLMSTACLEDQKKGGCEGMKCIQKN